MVSVLSSETGKFMCVIAGTGSIGQRHVRILSASGKADVYAFPVHPQRLSEIQDAKIQMIENWKQVRDLGVTHAIIATDTRRHADDVKSAFDAGCHVLVEKPMTINVTTAQQVAQLAKQSNLNLRDLC